VYVEKTTGRRWYVDNLHSGAAAELEVFDKWGKHLGSWSIDGISQSKPPVPGRRL
jgi:hypothetical protein